MWMRRTMSVVVVLGALFAGWGMMVDLRGDVGGFSGWQAVIQQSVVKPGLVPLVTAVGWVAAACGWAVLVSFGRARKDAGWDVGLVGLWAFCGAVWAQVLMVANGDAGSEFMYFDLGFGFWLFLVGLFFSIAIRFTEAVFEMILELFSSP